MKLDKNLSLDEKYLKAVEYLQLHDSIRKIILGLDPKFLDCVKDPWTKQKIIDIVEFLSILHEDKSYSRVRKGEK